MAALKQLAALSALLIVSSHTSTPVARADVLQCPYPATGFYAHFQPGIGDGQYYVCDYPVEINGSHLHAELGGYSTSGQLGGGGPMLGGNNTFGLSLGVGLTLWSQSWRCPDERYMAAAPQKTGEAPGMWKNPITPTKCVAIARAPLAVDAPWPPENTDQEVLFPPPDNPAIPPPAPTERLSPSVTDPVPTNPDSLRPIGN